MNRLSRIKIGGFRRLLDVELPMQPLSVLIGANGVGKTSILDVFSLLAASAEGKLNSRINELGGMSSILTYDLAQNLTLAVATEPGEGLQLLYSLNIAPAGPFYAIESESLKEKRESLEVVGSASIRVGVNDTHVAAQDGVIVYWDNGKRVEKRESVSPTWEHSFRETALSQVPRNLRVPGEFRSFLASSTFYHLLEVGPRAPVRLPQSMRPAELPGADGEDLLSCLYYMRETNRPRFEAIEDTLRVAFPGFDRLEFPPVAAGTISMTWRDAHFSKPIYPHQFSEGMLRFLWLAALLASPGLPAITLIDEPEVSLHPELLNLLAELMREASQRTQLIVATHSDRFVGFLKPSELVVMDIDEKGLAKMTRADQLDLQQWLVDYSLDEVWRMGLMGGRA
jgi:predicted ATPase